MFLHQYVIYTLITYGSLKFEGVLPIVVRSQYEQTLTILSARVDDIPLLLAHVARMGAQPLLDTDFQQLQGNLSRKGFVPIRESIGNVPWRIFVVVFSWRSHNADAQTPLS